MILSDKRLLQFIIMSALLLFGVSYRDFSIQLPQIVLTFGAGLLTQTLFLKYLNISQRGYLSALISCLGLCLLLRSNTLWVHPLTASLMISSKFFIRIQGQHLFNPANLGVILAISFFPNTWVTSGQWGADFTSAAWLIVAGLFIASRVQRLDISLYFLSFYSLIFIVVRVIYYGYPLAVYSHQFQNGALLLFSFFMISDPMTTPRHHYARILHAALVAIITYLWQYYFYWHQGVIWALFITSFFVPLWNKLLPAPSYYWTS